MNPTTFSALRGCFVTGTDTDAGKTCISAALLHWCAQLGLRSAGYKPVAAGMECVDGVWANDDVRVLRKASSVQLTYDRPKVQSAIRALEEGVQRVHFIDGRLPHSLLLEIFTDNGIGTEIVHG